MNWSAYSRLVGNVFGGPLAMEGLVAFFLESTFLGIWIFGWNRLSKKAHLATIWLVAAGTMLSAAFIMAANSWMQHPVGYAMNNQTDSPSSPTSGPSSRTRSSSGATSTSLLASLVTGGVLMLAVAAWHLRRQHQVEAFRRAAAISLAVLLPAVTLALFVGSELGVVEATYQPMKIAAAEAQWNTCDSHCPFSAVPDRRREQRPHADPDHRNPEPAVHPRHQQHEREGGGPHPAQRAVPEGVRAGELRPQRLHSVLVDAGHGLSGHAGLPLRRLGRLAALPQETRTCQVVPAHRAMDGDPAVPHQHGRVDADRERAPALDRPGPDEDGQRRLPLGLGHRHLDLHHRLRARSSPSSASPTPG